MSRRTTCTTIAVTLALLAVVPRAASAARAGHEGLPNVDRRAATAASVPTERRQARRALARGLGPLGDVRTQRASGAVAYVGRADGLLSGPSRDDPRAIALDYVRANGGVFGLGRADVANLRLVARAVSPDGITHLRFNQVLRGIESFDSGLDAHVTRDGRLITVSGGPLAGAELASTTPALGALGGLGAARRAARGSGLPPRVTAARAGAGRVTTFATGERAQLRWAATAGGPVLAWHVIVDGADDHVYDVLVAADDGRLLRRADLTHHLGEIRYFPRDPDGGAPTQITMPPAWFDDSAGGTRLWGQLSRTYLDPADVDPAAGGEGGAGPVQVPASGGAPAAPDWLFTQSTVFPGAAPCPTSGCTWDAPDRPTAVTNQAQASANLHALVSRFHDHLAQPPIGFDEASGNFQRTNASGQGLGGDYVRSEANDGEGFNNANMSTPPDGQPPRMQMYLFTGRNANGSDNADIVYHEYGHGLSARLVTTAGGSSALFSFQSQMMGEAWSDFYALDLLETEGSLVDTPAAAEVTTGAYAVGTGGVRAKPSDCPVDPAGIAGCDGHHGSGSVLGGYTYGDLAVVNTLGPHNGGEVWTETLWDIRTAVGSPAALALVTGGMRLSVDGPSMLDMRDAILQQAIATRSAPGAADDHYATLWTIFASRGMGAGATTPDADSTTPTEAFDVPSGLRDDGTVVRDPYPEGDNDGRIEPGERFVVEQTLTGIGLVDLAGVTGTLSSSDPAIAIEDGTAAWPLLGRGRTAVNGDALAARMPAGSCSATSTIAIAITSTEGDVTATATVDPRIGSATVVAIPDGVTVSAPLQARGSGTITDVDVRIDELRHTWLGDLVIELVHGGVTRTLFDPPDDWDGDDVVDLIVDDEAGTPMPDGGATLTGRVRPEVAGTLDDFDGLPAAGAWTLRITDVVGPDPGELRGWGLDSPDVDCDRLEIPAAGSASVTAGGHDSATVVGSVTPNGRATGMRFAYGRTTAYGATTAVVAAGDGDAPVGTSAVLTGLAPSTTYHLRVEAIREGGVVAVAGPDATLTTAAAPSPPPPPPPPSSSPPPSPPADGVVPRFVGSISVALGARRGGRRAPTFRFRLSEPATVRAALTRSASGVRSGGRCVAPPRRPRRGVRRCTRQVAAGSARRTYRTAGGQRLSLTGPRLRRGSYTATLTATDAAGNRSRPATRRFGVR